MQVHGIASPPPGADTNPSTGGIESRCVVRCLEGAHPALMSGALAGAWAGKGAAEAATVLASPLFGLSVARDRDVQLSRLREIDDHVKVSQAVWTTHQRTTLKAAMSQGYDIPMGGGKAGASTSATTTSTTTSSSSSTTTTTPPQRRATSSSRRCRRCLSSRR